MSEGDNNGKPKLTRHQSTRSWLAARTTAIGVVLCLVASLGFTANSLVAKLLLQNGDTNSFFLTFSRSALMAFYTWPVIGATQAEVMNRQDLRTHWKVLSIRCLGGTVGLLMYYAAVSYSPLSEAGVIFNACAPIFTSILAFIILRERFHYLDLLLIAMSIIGVVLILRPPFVFPPELASSGQHDIPFQDRLIGSCCALGASICQASAVLCFRAMKRLNSSVIVWWYSVSGAVMMVLPTQLLGHMWLPPCYLARLGACICGLSSCLGQLLLTFASRYVSSAVVALIRSSELAFLFAAQTVILQTVPHWLSLFGSSIVVLAMIILITRSFIIDKLKQAESRTDHSFFAPNSRFYSYLVLFTK